MVFNETVAAIEEIHTFNEADEEWLSVNRDVLLESHTTIDAMKIVDHMINTSGGQFLNPTENQYKIICSQETARDKLRALLNVLTTTPAADYTPLFKNA